MGLTVEFVDLAEAEAARDAWQDLCARALEPNIFMEPSFALAASQLLAESQRPRFALLWDRPGAESARTLLGVWPVSSRAGSFNTGVIRSWESVQAVQGTPLIDRARAVEVADAFFHALGTVYRSSVLLVVPHLLKAGPTYGLLVSRALATDRSWSGLSSHKRAVLHAGSDPAALRAGFSARRRSRLARQQRRFAELGAVSFRTSGTPDAIRAATEQFLVLEGSGWKGARATALLSFVGSATFARAMVRLLARTGQCRIESLELDGQPVAMAVILKSGNRAYFWKIAFDERFAAYSPGVLLTLEITARQLADPDLAMTDSCAVAGHPMIEAYWPDRHEVVDLAVAVMPGESPGTATALRRERLRRGLRDWAKTSIRNVKGLRARWLRAGQAAPPSPA